MRIDKVAAGVANEVLGFEWAVKYLRKHASELRMAHDGRGYVAIVRNGHRKVRTLHNKIYDRLMRTLEEEGIPRESVLVSRLDCEQIAFWLPVDARLLSDEDDDPIEAAGDQSRRKSHRHSRSGDNAAIEWLGENFEALQRDYPGEWVAIAGAAVVGHDKTLDTALRQAAGNGHTDPLVFQVTNVPAGGLYL